MRFLSGLVLVIACSEPVQPSTGFGGLGERCGIAEPCAEGLNCRGGLCLAQPRDAGLATSDVGNSMGDSGAGVQDTGSAGIEDAGSERRVEIVLNRPEDGLSIEGGERFDAVAEVLGEDLAGLDVRWSSSLDGELGRDQISPMGRVLRSVTLSQLGIHDLIVEVLDGDVPLARDSIAVGVCGWQMIGDFERDLEGWQRFGDARRDPGGWLELTGNARSRKGAIYKVSESIQPGDVRLAFRISTGQCDEPGVCNLNPSDAADGFAMNIWDVDSPEALGAIFEAARRGGGLAYGVGGPYGDFEGKAFHVEFDTWYNDLRVGDQRYTDPTRQNHVAVTLDGNPFNHVAFAELPSIEDNRWHEVELVIDRDRVRVSIDGQSVIDQRVEGLDFKGGYIGFSGTTGYFTNYHRFDELRTRPACEP